MSLVTKWLLTSVGGGVLLAVVVLLALPLGPFGSFDPPSTIELVVLWPVIACLYLVPGPGIGPPQKHWHEWTPVQDVALAVGIGFSWTFYSSLVFVLLWFRSRRRAGLVPPRT